MSESEAQRPEAAERVREMLEIVKEALGLDAEIRVEQDEEGIRGVLYGDDLGLFIGRHGQTIDAVQHLAFKAANRDGGRGGVRVVVDAAGYRSRREQALHRQAEQAAADAIRGGRPVALDAMSATERDRKSTRLNSSHTVIYTLSLHDAPPISLAPRAGAAPSGRAGRRGRDPRRAARRAGRHERHGARSEEHTSELQSHRDLHSFPTRRSSDLARAASRRCTVRPSRPPRTRSAAGGPSRWTP